MTPGTGHRAGGVARPAGLTLPGATVKGTAVAPLRPASQLTAVPDAVGLPVSPELSDVLPWPGLRPGATIALRAAGPSGLTSLLLGLLGPASRAGAWCAVAGVRPVPPQTAARAGVAVSRLAWVPELGAAPDTVIGALVDGIDVVAVNLAAAPAPATLRRLAARTRKHGTVLIPFGTAEWPHADATLTVTRVTWHGLRQGTGRLRHCELRVTAHTRGRPRDTVIWPYGKPAEATTPGLATVISIDEQRERHKGVNSIARARREVS